MRCAVVFVLVMMACLVPLVAGSEEPQRAQGRARDSAEDRDLPSRAARPVSPSRRADPDSISPIPARKLSPVNGQVTLPTRHPKTTTGQIIMPETDGPTDDGEYPRACVAPQRPRDPVLLDEARERARELLAEIGVEVGDTLSVARVLDERIERADGSVLEVTHVYCEQRYEGLPILYGRVGFVFYQGDPEMRGDDANRRTIEQLVREGDIKSDVWPQVERGEALDIYRKIGLESPDPMRLPFPSDDGCEPRAELVLWNEKAGWPNPPHYLLVWNVRPGNSNYPQAIIDARYGEVHRFDGGIRH